MGEFPVQSWRAAVEILILAMGIYFILRIIRGTRGARVLLGLVTLLLFLSVASELFGLRTINWLLGRFFEFTVVALVVIFQPELRRALAQLGSGPIFFTVTHERAVVDILVRAAANLSARRVGALVAVEREINLRGLAEAGAPVDARLSVDLLDQLFYPHSPLHDGGVVVQNDRILAAACIFPLTQRADLAASMGTRHRAAIGLSEETDAVVIVVSEETGGLAIACDGALSGGLTVEELHAKLVALLVGRPVDLWLGRWRALLARLRQKSLSERA
ncbi:MAG: TIGR00159 family protein [Verrucomicrobiae bacterium]|nr:TIGR00159 family protein [Verrucomicrobiae bacterium]